jgi:hypothetical protein
MACGSCGYRAKAAAEYKFVYTNTRGEQTTYDNQFEARSRVLREGGTWAKVPVTA